MKNWLDQWIKAMGLDDRRGKGSGYLFKRTGLAPNTIKAARRSEKMPLPAHIDKYAEMMGVDRDELAENFKKCREQKRKNVANRHL